jgi:hypothetical protein
MKLKLDYFIVGVVFVSISVYTLICISYSNLITDEISAFAKVLGVAYVGLGFIYICIGLNLLFLNIEQYNKYLKELSKDEI